MAIILGLETSTSICSVAIMRNGLLAALRETTTTNGHSALLTAFISETAAQAGITLQQIDAVAVSIGPGSYTGLRIGVSTAKGLCYSLGKPLITVDTLKALALQMLSHISGIPRNGEIILHPMIDARRMEVFTAGFNLQLECITPVDAVVIDENSFSSSDKRQIYIAGDGASKCMPHFANYTNIQLLDGICTSATTICELGTIACANGQFADTAYCEPFYFKDFIPGKPRVKGLD